MRPFRTEEHAGIVFEPKEHLHDVEIVLVPGWTSLGDGMAKLGYVLSRMGFRVHLLHPPTTFGGTWSALGDLSSLSATPWAEGSSSSSGPVEYMEIVRRFGGYGKGALLLGSKDGLVPHTDELYHYEHGIPKENVIHIEVFRGGHGFFADEKNIRAVAERIAQIALGFMGRR